MSPLSKCQFTVSLEVGRAEHVPGVLQLPAANPAAPSAPSAPSVLLLHGFTSRKERMADSLGRALLERGVASLAIDLPMHGGRDGTVEALSMRNPMALVQKWKLGVREANAALEYLAAHPSLDPRRIAIAGYSLGAFLATVVAADNPLVRSVVDPRRAVQLLRGRALYMVNGQNDRTVKPAQARTLYEAAGEPKELHWYNGGH
jgi:dienelactone hydrolase